MRRKHNSRADKQAAYRSRKAEKELGELDELRRLRSIVESVCSERFGWQRGEGFPALLHFTEQLRFIPLADDGDFMARIGNL